jgi:DNA modification methylase
MIKLYQGNCLTVLKTLEPESINCCVTSPPYFGLRDYGVDGQLGLEKTPEEFVENLVKVFRETKRVLKDDGTLWLNLGDSYAANGGHKQSAGNKQNTNKGSIKHEVRKPSPGLKQKDLIGIPWRVAFALQADGWYLRQDIIWSKPNPMPESVKDRCTKSHEYIFLFSKSPKYYYDYEAIKEPAICGNNGSKFDTGKTGINKDRNWKKRPSAKKGSFNGKTEAMANTGQNAFRSVVDKRNKRDVWEIEDHNSLIQWLSETNPELLNEYFDTTPDVWKIATKPYKEAHFATFPPDLIKPCILAGCPEGGVVLDTFMGSGTVGEVSKINNRSFKGIELNPEYLKLSEKRIGKANYQLGF